MTTGTKPRKQFSESLSSLKEQVMEMGLLVDSMVADAVTAVIERDEELAQQTLLQDNKVDQAELEIQSTAMVLIAREQPVAHDLRFIASAMNTAGELERIGDDAVSIAKKGITLIEDVPREYVPDLRKLSELARSMLLNALRAFSTDDTDRLDEVIASDTEVDRLWKSLRRRLREDMKSNPESLFSYYKIIQAAHHLEYVGDHAVSIAERLEFVRTGNLVRFSKVED